MKREALRRKWIKRSWGAGWDRLEINYQRRYRHATRPGYGMGMGKNTLIHKGRKP